MLDFDVRIDCMKVSMLFCVLFNLNSDRNLEKKALKPAVKENVCYNLKKS